MIDIHCHILPGIDDGAKSFDESLEILRQAEKEGVTDVILTPHYMKGTIYNAGNVKKWGLYQELKRRMAEAGLKVNLYLGNEIYIDEKLPEMLGGYTGATKQEGIYELSTLNSRRYVLVELPVQSEDKSAKQTLFRLVQMGFIPVVAHPERYYYVQTDEHYMDDFLQMGCVLQGDYMALLGKYGKAAEKTLKKLLFAGKIFCLASDIHKPGEYKLEQTQKKLMRILRSKEKIKQLLIDNPKLILG